MAPFNAVVRDEGKRILARTRITSQNLSKIPWNWTVTYNEKEVITIGRHILCTSSKPLNIIKASLSAPVKKSRNYTIRVRCFAKVGIAKMQVTQHNTPADLFKMTARYFGKDPAEFRLDCKNIRIPNTASEKLIKKYPCVTREVIEMRPILVGGAPSGFIMANIEAGGDSGMGVRLKFRSNLWRAYGKGLNIVGRCASIHCPSNQEQHLHEDVYFRLEFAKHIVNLANFDRFDCPACKRRGCFKPLNFLIGGARATFRYRKIGDNPWDNDVRRVTLEAPGPFPQYATFNENGGTAEYEFIEITTVKMNHSTQICIACDLKIQWVEEETRKKCDHVFHPSCARVSVNCPLCITEERSLEEIVRPVSTFHGV